MVNLNRVQSDEKITCAITAIGKMQQENEKITIVELTKRTGFSRGFFYKNPKVRRELERAFEDQKGKTFINQRQAIFDKALEKKVIILEDQNDKLKQTVQELEKEIRKLKKSLNKKEINFIKNL